MIEQIIDGFFIGIGITVGILGIAGFLIGVKKLVDRYKVRKNFGLEHVENRYSVEVEVTDKLDGTTFTGTSEPRD